MATVTFDYELDNNSDFSSPIVSVTDSSSVNYTPSTLANGEYWFRLRQHEGGGTSGWITRHFYVLDLPAVPTLSSPADASYDADTTPTFTAAAPANDTQANTSAATAGSGVGASSGSAVRTYQKFVTGTTGRLREIKITLGANTGSPTGDLRWMICSDSASEPGTILLSGTFTPVPNSEHIITLNAFAANNLNAGTYWLGLETVNTLSGTNYYLWNMSVGGYGSGAAGYRIGAGAFNNLATNDMLFSVKVLTGAAVQVDTWEFQLTSSGDTGFASPILNVTGLTTPSYTAPTQADGNYLWRFRARNASGVSSWATARLLHIQQVPSAITLLTPTSLRSVQRQLLGSGLTSPSAFTWTADALADTYDFQFSANSDMSSPIVDATGIATTNYAPVWSPDPPTAGTRYWRVRGVNETGNGAWSSTRQIEVTEAAWDWVAATSGFRVAWWGKDSDGVLLKAINPYIAEGRDLVTNGTFTSALTPWTGTNWSQTSGVARHTTGNTAALSQTGLMAVGKMYKVVFTTINRTAGTLTGSDGAARSTNATFIAYFIATATALTFTPSSDFDGDIDNVSLTQINIRPSSDFPRLNVAQNWEMNFDVAWSGTNWAHSSGGYVHTPGSTQPLRSTSSTCVPGKSYDYEIIISGRTAGQVTVRGGTTGTPGSAITSNGTSTGSVTVGGSTGIDVIPDTNFDGKIESIRFTPTDGFLIGNGYFGTDASLWSAQAAAVLSVSSGRLRITYGGTTAPRADQTVLIVGRRYRLTCKVWGDGTFLPRIGTSSSLFFSGTSSTSQQDVDITFTADQQTLRVWATATSAGYVEIDDVLLEEINPLDGVITGLSVNGSANVAFGGEALVGDGSTTYINLYSAELNSIVDFSEGTFVCGVKEDNWSLGSIQQYGQISVSTNDELRLRALSNANNFYGAYVGGGVTKNPGGTTSTSDPFMLSVTWDVAGDAVTTYFNDTTPGGTQNTVTTATGNLSSSRTVAMAANTSGANSVDGDFYFLALLNDAKDETWHDRLAQLVEVT